MKINGPLFSLTASGSLGKEITFSQRRSGQEARFQHRQKNSKTALQLEQQEAFILGIELWGSLDGDERAFWKQIMLFGDADV